MVENLKLRLVEVELEIGDLCDRSDRDIRVQLAKDNRVG